jgi:hypothetical protein
MMGRLEILDVNELEYREANHMNGMVCGPKESFISLIMS